MITIKIMNFEIPIHELNALRPDFFSATADQQRLKTILRKYNFLRG